jgi:hypothetical protein
MKAAVINISTGIIAIAIVSNKCLVLARPIKSNTIQLEPNSKAVERLAGR